MPPPAPAALNCLGFPQERLRQLSLASGLSLWHPDNGPANAKPRVVLLLGQAWEDQIPAYFTSPYASWIEVAALPDPPVLELVERAANSDFYASFTTVSANSLDLAGNIVQAIAVQRSLSNTCRDNIELALHEALCNALVHGNLQMEGIGDLSFEALERFSSNLLVRMTDPDFANRRIDVIFLFESDGITVDVIDQGCGFEPKPKTVPKASGRGFELIEASCLSFRLMEGGRRVSMRFAL